jgi:type I restriction-modification system DNA methylase subunit
MSKYVCELCKKNFKQKSDYDKHKNKKTPCITLDEIQKITITKEVKNNNKTNLTTIFKYCLDVLRDNEHLTGDKALRTLAHLLDLRLLEPQFGKTIDIDEYNYDFSHIEENMIDNHKNKLLSIVRFSKLAQEKEENIPINMKYLWDDILAVHPKTKNIFLNGRGFDITNQSTYKKLITKLNSFDFESIEADILGEAYEEVIQDVMIGKTLGQFFTPPKVKKMMVKLIDPQINKNGSIERIFDPAMGTGGFLITCLRHLINQSKTKNIKLDWDFIRKEGLGGREAEPDTYQLAVSNMLISSGHMFDVLEKGDSIRNPITNKYDIVLANPPFGIDGLTYDDINHSLRNEYLPIKSNSAVPLFLQAIIYQLKINGRCAIVLPEGQELFSKSNVLVAIREFLMKTCDLKEVTYLPAGTFTHTTIKTCVFYFIKKREGKDVLETNIKVSKTTQKETGREYKFSKTHQTTKVHFYDYNPDNDVKHSLIEGGVSIDELSKNNYSLNYAEYLKDNIDDEVYEDGIIVKTLGEVCKFMSKSKRQASFGNKEGNHPFFTSSQICNKYCNEYDYEDECLIIGTGGTANVKYSNKFSCSTDNFVIKINNGIITKYIYYYLFINIKIIQKGFIGVGIQHISKEYLGNITILIPSLEKQKKIVEYCESNNNLINQLENEIEQNKIQANLFLSSIVKKIKIEQDELSIDDSVSVKSDT